MRYIICYGLLFLSFGLKGQVNFIGEYLWEDDYLSFYVDLLEDSSFEVTHISENSKNSHVGVGRWKYVSDSIVLFFKDSVTCSDIIDTIIYSNVNCMKDSITIKILDKYGRPVEYFQVFPCEKCLKEKWDNNDDFDMKLSGCKFEYTNDKGEFRFKFLNYKLINLASASYYGGVNCCLDVNIMKKDIVVKLKVNAELYYLLSTVKVYRSKILKFKQSGEYLKSKKIVLKKSSK